MSAPEIQPRDVRDGVPREGAPYFWAKTTADGKPGISVRDHCLNVGCVAEALIELLPQSIRELLPPGAVTLAALHDVGKISAGFLRKCPAWLAQEHFTTAALSWTTAESDHSLVSQFCLQELLRPARAELWAVTVGAHHGRIHGKRLRGFNVVPDRSEFEEQARNDLVKELAEIFGALPDRRPCESYADLWLLAGIIAAADWIASNERFFSPTHGLPLPEARERAVKSLSSINWGGGNLSSQVRFEEMFNLPDGPNPLQRALQDCAAERGLFIAEGPMGCGKTEAALAAAHTLIASGQNHGLYFALPTQVTSNRIHQRVAAFLKNTLVDSGNLRLAHSTSWLDEGQTLLLSPSANGDAPSRRDAAESRWWFASSKHALLARYGVGTIDQALQSVVAVKHFFVRRFGLAGKVVVLDEVHSYDVYTGALITQLIRELLALHCSVIVLSATLTRARREQLLAAAGAPQPSDTGTSNSKASSEAYPLVTVFKGEGQLSVFPFSWSETKIIKLRVAPMSEDEMVGECVGRAEAGQHVLYIRNTVVEAQAAYRAFASEARSGRLRVGLLHSRFPFFRREELEDEWLQRLGKTRERDGLGSILVATQVVEQSVDIDLDFIVSDLAPTDMLLQRMGRLWRHLRTQRAAACPEFWINLPSLDFGSSARDLKAALGKSARVYAPYVLLRTREVFLGRESITLPTQIRELLEATYADRAPDSEPKGWVPLQKELEDEKEQLANEAKVATLVLGRPTQADRDEVLTRRAGAPTFSVVLVSAAESLPGSGCRLVMLDGTTIQASDYDWRHANARALYRNLVRAPRFAVPKQEAPRWLLLHVPGQAAWGIVQADGHCHFPDAADASRLGYDGRLGLFTDSSKPQPRQPDTDDDEFDY